MDKFGGSQEPSVSTKPSVATKQSLQSTSVELPASYGRALPISEEEIEAINVSIHQVPSKRAINVCYLLAGWSKIAAAAAAKFVCSKNCVLL